MENKLPFLVSEDINEDLNTDWDDKNDDEEHDDDDGGSGDKDNVCEDDSKNTDVQIGSLFCG